MPGTREEGTRPSRSVRMAALSRDAKKTLGLVDLVKNGVKQYFLALGMEVTVTEAEPLVGHPGFGPQSDGRGFGAALGEHHWGGGWGGATCQMDAAG